MKIEHSNPTALAKRAFFLAYQACGGTFGMGILQARDGATEDDVWENVKTRGDYPSAHGVEPDRPYGDYVFGRMMKLGLEVHQDGVSCIERKPTPDYQAWSRRYPTYESLVRAAADSLASQPV